MPKRDANDVNMCPLSEITVVGHCPTTVISDMYIQKVLINTVVLIKEISSAIINLLGQSKGKESANGYALDLLTTLSCVNFPRVGCSVWTSGKCTQTKM